MTFDIPKVRYVAAPSEQNMCVIACLAMITGQTLKQTLKGMERFWNNEGMFEGVREEPFYQYLSARGYAIQTIDHDYEPEDSLTKPWPPAPWAPIHCCDVYAEGPHAVIMLHNGKILDPNDRKVKTLSEYHRVYSVQGIWKVGHAPPTNIVSP